MILAKLFLMITNNGSTAILMVNYNFMVLIINFHNDKMLQCVNIS